jgi:hypothetical protein
MWILAPAKLKRLAYWGSRLRWASHCSTLALLTIRSRTKQQWLRDSLAPGAHHICERLVEQLGPSLTRETLRQGNFGFRQKRRPPAHPMPLHSARVAELVRLEGSLHDCLKGRGPLLVAPGTQDDAWNKTLIAAFFPGKTTFGYLCLPCYLPRRHGLPVASRSDRSGVFVRNDDHWAVQELPAEKRQPHSVRSCLVSAPHQLGITVVAADGPRSKGRIKQISGHAKKEVAAK